MEENRAADVGTAVCETVNERLAVEASVGYNICGINGCILADRHPGECVFQELGSRKRRQVDLQVKMDAPQHLTSDRTDRPKAKAPSAAKKPSAGDKPKKAKGGTAPKKKPPPTAAPRAAAPADEDEDEDEDVPCMVCGRKDDHLELEGAMLLCEGTRAPPSPRSRPPRARRHPRALAS